MSAETRRILLDRDCPGCGWPEIVAVGLADGGPDHVECARRAPCGWQSEVKDGTFS